MAKARSRNAKTAILLFSFAGGMVGLAFASAPLYRLFCQVTGFGGTPQVVSELKATPSEKTIAVRFDANVNPALPWRFKPGRREITVKAGVPTKIVYWALNTSGQTTTGTSTFNVTPYKAAKYFSKIDCFCFTNQRLAPGQEASLGVQFYVDPEIFNDPNTREVKTITLSYTFFRSRDDDTDAEPAKQVQIPARITALAGPAKS